MPQKRLPRPEDLIAVSEASQESPQERHVKMQNNLRVLEQSIQAQVGVAQSFESNPAQYAQAIRFVEGMRDTYGELRLEAAVLDLEILLGGKLQVAGFLEGMAQQLRAPQTSSVPPDGTAQPQTAPQNTDAVPPAVEPHSGTSVAGGESKSEEDTPSTPADEPEETVN
jgi:hypothetical protein